MRFDVQDEFKSVCKVLMELLAELAKQRVNENPGVTLHFAQPTIATGYETRFNCRVADIILPAFRTVIPPGIVPATEEAEIYRLGIVLALKVLDFADVRTVMFLAWEECDKLCGAGFSRFLSEIESRFPTTRGLWMEHAQLVREAYEREQERGQPGRSPDGEEAELRALQVEPDAAEPEQPAEQPDERGPKAGTFERVREAHRLLKTGRFSQRDAMKRAKTDVRTYQRHCRAATGEDPIISHLLE
jgi:hypothetical protein